MEKDEKRIEDLVKKFMEADTLETPSFDFTDKVISKVEALSNTSVTTYKPIIPKYVRWFLVASFVSFFGYVLFSSSSSSSSSGSSLSERYNLPDVSLNPFDGLSFDFSSTLMYATLFLALMVCIQIPLMKQYFNNRLSY